MINGKIKTKKRSFNYLFLLIGTILVLHITFLWSQQELVELKSLDVKLSPNSVDKSFALSGSSTTKSNQTDSINTIPSPRGNIIRKASMRENHTLPDIPIIISSTSKTKEESVGDKSRIVSILETAGINVTDDILARLPTWDTIQSLYGPSPIIHGLETCSTFQHNISKAEAYIGPAGTFNTGTNLLAELLPKYCMIDKEKKRSGMLWQVPWGKHNPISWRFKNIAIAGGKDVKNQGTVLPVVTIKDPYSWMGSMCRNSYAADWPSSKDHCPNLILNEVDKAHGIHGNPETGRTTVTVFYKATNTTTHDTLVGFWNDWYGNYVAIKEFPRIIVRYEDILFHTTEVVQEICKCGGGTLKSHGQPISLIAASAKGSEGPHAGANGLLSAILRYGNPATRIEGMTKSDIDFAGSHLRKDLMSIFHYQYARGGR